MERVQTQISRELLEEVRKRATREGRQDSEIIEEAVRGYLLGRREGRSKELPEIFEEIDCYQQRQGVEPLSEEEAMKMAVEEQHAWREERREAEGR